MTFNFDEFVIDAPDPEVSVRAPEISRISEQEPRPAPDISINFDEFAVKEEPTMAEEGLRHVARVGSRVGEALAGLPGDFVQFSKWLGSKLPEGPKFLQRDPTWGQKQFAKLLDSLPTSSEFKSKMSEISGGYTDPQGAMEEFGDEIAGLATVLMFGKDPRKISNLLVAGGKALTAKSAAKTSELYGAGPLGQTGAEISALMLMGMFNPGATSKFISDKYQRARSLLPPSDVINSKRMAQRLGQLEKELEKGISTTSKNEVKRAIGELKGKAEAGTIAAEETVEAYHNINERRSSKGLFNELSKSERRSLKRHYDKFQDIVSDEIEAYGKTNNPFNDEWRSANQAYRTVEESKMVSNFIEGHLGKLPKNVAGGMAIELFTGMPLVAGATGGTFTALKTGEMLARISKDPSLRKHYVNVFAASAAKNVPALTRSLEKLEDGLQKSFASEKDAHKNRNQKK